MLRKEVSSTIFKVFGMTPPGIEPWSPGPLSNSLPTRPMSSFLALIKIILMLLLSRLSSSIYSISTGMGEENFWIQTSFTSKEGCAPPAQKVLHLKRDVLHPVIPAQNMLLELHPLEKISELIFSHFFFFSK